MRLEHVCDMQSSYQGGFSLVKPYGGEEGSGYGQGDGRAIGPNLSGTVQWANHPRRRSDGRMLPDASGLLTTEDGAKVTFLLQGRTVFGMNAKGERTGGQNLVMWFEAEDERCRWLNDTMCVVEGVIAGLGNIRFRVYACVNELLGASGGRAHRSRRGDQDGRVDTRRVRALRRSPAPAPVVTAWRNRLRARSSAPSLRARS